MHAPSGGSADPAAATRTHALAAFLAVLSAGAVNTEELTAALDRLTLDHHGSAQVEASPSPEEARGEDEPEPEDRPGHALQLSRTTIHLHSGSHLTFNIQSTVVQPSHSAASGSASEQTQVSALVVRPRTELPRDRERHFRSYAIWKAPGAQAPIVGVHTGRSAWTHIEPLLAGGCYRTSRDRLRGANTLDEAIELFRREAALHRVDSEPTVFFW